MLKADQKYITNYSGSKNSENYSLAWQETIGTMYYIETNYCLHLIFKYQLLQV